MQSVKFWESGIQRLTIRSSLARSAVCQTCLNYLIFYSTKSNNFQTYVDPPIRADSILLRSFMFQLLPNMKHLDSVI